MFAAYWPVMAFVAGIILVLSVLTVSMGRLCRARLDPLPERDLTSYLQDDEQDVAEYADYEQDGDFSLEITNHLNYPDSMHQSDTGHSV